MSSSDYPANRKFGDKFMPEITAILGQFLLCPSSPVEDMERNTDLIVVTMEAKRIAVRIRRYGAYLKFPYDVTFRYGWKMGHRRRENGEKKKSELHKIIYDEYGDYFFYGFADETETRLIYWCICDLKAFRKYAIKQTVIGGNKVLTHNPDGSSRVYPNTEEQDSLLFAINRYLIPDFVLKESEPMHGWESQLNEYRRLEQLSLFA